MSELHGGVIEAGRELDALVTGKVMEWKKEKDNPYWLGSNMECHERIEFDALYAEEIQLPWSPSTDISAAWEVVEKVYELTDKWILVSPFNKRFCAYHKTGCGDEDYGDFCEYGETAPHAICLAALKAID